MGKIDITALIEYLQGSCKSLQEGIRAISDEEFTEDDLTSADYEEIDNEIFECIECGWWHEVGDMSEDADENICIECYEE